MKIRHVDVIVLAAPGNYGLTPDGAESQGSSILLQEDPESLAQFIELGSGHRCRSTPISCRARTTAVDVVFAGASTTRASRAAIA